MSSLLTPQDDIFAADKPEETEEKVQPKEGVFNTVVCLVKVLLSDTNRVNKSFKI